MHYMFITWTGYFYKDTWIDRLLFVSYRMHAMNYISIFKVFFAPGMQDAKVKKYLMDLCMDHIRNVNWDSLQGSWVKS